MNYDLENRTMLFSKRVISFAKGLKINYLNKDILVQLIRSATSIGANYREANGACSKRDFTNKIALSRKEARETEYWLEIMADIETDRKDELRELWAEAHELVLIFGKIFLSLKN